MEKQKTNRFNEIDLARAIPLIFLPIVHVYEQLRTYGILAESATKSGEILLFLCVLGPSVFMIILGMNIAFSSHTLPKQLLRRGLITIAIFFIHNIFRYVIPFGVADIFLKSQYLSYLMLVLFLLSDILMFAGISFMYFALMKKMKFSPIKILIVSIILMIIGCLLQSDTEATLLTTVLGNFVRADYQSSFPALVWLIYPSVGYLIGEKMKLHEDEKNRKCLYNKLALIGLALIIIPVLILLLTNQDILLVTFSVVNDNFVNVYTIAINIGIAFIWFKLMYDAYKLIKSEKIKNIVTYFSKNIMTFYVIQWILVGWLQAIVVVLFYDKHCFETGTMILISIVITILSILLIKPFEKLLNKVK